MDEFLRSHPLVAWIGAGLAFVVFVILLLHMVKILLELRRRIPSGERSRQLRLGFVENFDLDGERQLLLVRRDNVEHLLLIGGPNDVLVESGIVRAEARAPRGGFEPAQVAPSAPSGLVLAPTPAAANEARPEAPAPEPRPEVVRFEPKPAPLGTPFAPKPQGKPEPEPAPKLEGLPEIDLEQELKAALEATPLTPPEPEAEPAPVEPPPPPPPSRFAPPPRPTFRAPLPPRMPQGGSGFPGAPAPGGEQRPRFVIPPLARRTPAPPPPLEPPPLPVEPQAPAEPPAPDLFAPKLEPHSPEAHGLDPHKPEPHKPELEAPQAPPTRPDPETLESLEEEMAKLLGRPPRP